MSTDTIVPNPANPQNLNRYSYVLNNPLRYTDPTGHICQSEGPGDCEDEDGKPINGASGVIQKPETSTPPKPQKNHDDDDDTGPITDLILQLPGTADDWSNIGTGLDVLAWFTDLYAAGTVTYAYFGGAALPAPLIAAGLPEVPLATGFAGMAIAELYVQPVIFTANLLASLSTAATIISDTKAGNTRIEEGNFSTSVLNSMALTDIGWGSNEAFVSLGLQSVAVANDLQWISLPFTMLP